MENGEWRNGENGAPLAAKLQTPRATFSQVRSLKLLSLGVNSASALCLAQTTSIYL